MVHVSPPDKHGYCSWALLLILHQDLPFKCKKVIAQVNPNILGVHGDAFVDINRFDALVWTEDPLPEVRYDLTANGNGFQNWQIGCRDDRGWSHIAIGVEIFKCCIYKIVEP